MNETMRLSSRNALIQSMLSDNEGIKNYYRFTAQNPHFELHDACQIVAARPNASICFHFEEWNAMGRRVTKGRKGIPYVDRENNKIYVFDANDTHGDERYKRLIYPMKRLLIGLDKLNGTEVANDTLTDYRKIQIGVANYLKDNEYFTDDEELNKFLYEGISYSLYGLGGYGDGIYGASYDAKGMRLVQRSEDDYNNIIAQADLKWNEVANYIADLIDDDDYLTAEEKIEFANYEAQRYGIKLNMTTFVTFIKIAIKNRQGCIRGREGLFYYKVFFGAVYF